jgi:nucleoside-diphosphate-sugar epimerase
VFWIFEGGKRNMRALFIGGTGTISTAVSSLAVERGWELSLLNRGNNLSHVPAGAKVLTADSNDEEVVSKLIRDLEFDVVADFIAYEPSQIQRDVRLFAGKTRQFIFISSASAYQKPLSHFKVTESTPLSNPYWQYSRDKIACEEVLLSEYRDHDFPITIVRPSHTYNNGKVPLSLSGSNGCWQVIHNIMNEKPVIVIGDGSSLWAVTHSSDFAKAFVGLMGNHAAVGESVHITSDEVLTWNEIYDCVGAALGVRVKKVHVSSDFLIACKPDLQGGLLGDKANSVCFDNSKIKGLVPGYVATVRFDQGVRQSIAYLLAHPELQKPDAEFDRFCDEVMLAQNEAFASFRNRNKIETISV